MLLLDVNVLIGAFRPEANRHQELLQWLTHVAQSGEEFMIPDVVLSAVIRITTNPAIYRSANGPSPMPEVLRFCAGLRSRPAFRTFLPGRDHWELFERFCALPGIVGNHVSDAYLAAAALEQDAELVTLDRGFARFPGVRFRHPLDGQ